MSEIILFSLLFQTKEKTKDQNKKQNNILLQNFTPQLLGSILLKYCLEVRLSGLEGSENEAPCFEPFRTSGYAFMSRRKRPPLKLRPRNIHKREYSSNNGENSGPVTRPSQPRPTCTPWIARMNGPYNIHAVANQIL